MQIADQTIRDVAPDIILGVNKYCDSRGLIRPSKAGFEAAKVSLWDVSPARTANVADIINAAWSIRIDIETWHVAGVNQARKIAILNDLVFKSFEVIEWEELRRRKMATQLKDLYGELAGLDEESVFERIGKGASESGTLFEAEPSGGYGLQLPGYRELGLRIFKRALRDLREIVCGTAKEDESDRKDLLGALGADDASLGLVIAAVLSGSMGLSPDISIALAVLVVRKVIRPTGEKLCEYWETIL